MAAKDSGIGTFNNCTWGSSMETVKATVITSNMQENVDYQVATEDSITSLVINATQVAGYNTSASYLFVDDQLVAGLYPVEFPDSEYSTIQSKYCAVYGDPVIEKESTGWGACSIWVDSEHNFVFMSKMCGIVYGTENDTVLDLLDLQFSQFHEINIRDVLGKAGNLSGV